ncbi:hypothetical protein [Sporohalobacter salinus]|uniref:hypothetical protein n=1 Tax=Sporohalobacter salinus TaxID=1494606 RepID=UPI00196052D4|nr:hypothetical protein [Sporohalobacter salinus]MBM7623662.1 multisubunit Na+/H+ antiporter MnhE subunit [Sporohalobacter salinus]
MIRREGFLSGSISFLFLFFILGLIIGLIKPKLVIRWGTEEKTRKEVLKYYGLGLLLYSFLYGIVRAYIKFFKEHGLLEALLNFSCLFFILGLIVGLIKPNLVIRWRERKTRGQVLKYYGIGLILSSFLDMLF